MYINNSNMYNKTFDKNKYGTFNRTSTLNRVVRVCGGDESDIINYEESII